MLKYIKIGAVAISILTLSACSTTNSTPYKASTSNVMAIQEIYSDQELKIAHVETAQGVDESPLCRLMGPVKVAPGKTPAQYIEDAFKEELFLSQVYSKDADTELYGSIQEISFSSVSPAVWNIKMHVSSNKSPGYGVAVNYKFGTSWAAYSACQNVADAFGPAVQELLRQVVTHPQFGSLGGR